MEAPGSPAWRRLPTNCINGFSCPLALVLFGQSKPKNWTWPGVGSRYSSHPLPSLRVAHWLWTPLSTLGVGVVSAPGTDVPPPGLPVPARTMVSRLLVNPPVIPLLCTCFSYLLGERTHCGPSWKPIPGPTRPSTVAREGSTCSGLAARVYSQHAGPCSSLKLI